MESSTSAPEAATHSLSNFLTVSFSLSLSLFLSLSLSFFLSRSLALSLPRRLWNWFDKGHKLLNLLLMGGREGGEEDREEGMNRGRKERK